MMTTPNTETMNDQTSGEICMVENNVKFHKYNDRPIRAASMQQLIKRFNEGGNIGRDSEKKTFVDSAGGGNAKEEEMGMGYKNGEEEVGKSMELRVLNC
jgi:hypothetical protein